jgi:hypothetical protein
VAIVEDITEQRRAAAERERLFHEAQEAIRVRDDFLTIASHELKTPLTPLSLRLASLERRLERHEPVDPSLLRHARQHLVRLAALINDLLDASRIDSGRLALHLEPTRLDTIVERALTGMDVERGHHRIEYVHPPEPVHIRGDLYRLEQVIANLVENALKYSPGDSTVRVTLDVNADFALLSVADQGIGIPKDQQEQLFERYFRARAPLRPAPADALSPQRGQWRRREANPPPETPGERAPTGHHRRAFAPGPHVDRNARPACRLELLPVGANARRRCVPRGWVVLLCMVVLGCSGTAPSIRSTPEPPLRCVYIPRRDGAAGARKEAVTAQQAGMRVVLVAATAGAAPVEPLTPVSAPSLEGLSGEGLGDGVARGVLRLVPEGGPSAEVGTGGAAGEVVGVGGAVVAAIGSGLLVCLTARAAANGEKTPIDITDEYYGTHFGDVKGWVQGQYPTQTSPGVAPKPEPDKLGAPWTMARDIMTSRIGGFAGESSS